MLHLTPELITGYPEGHLLLKVGPERTAWMLSSLLWATSKADMLPRPTDGSSSILEEAPTVTTADCQGILHAKMHKRTHESMPIACIWPFIRPTFFRIACVDCMIALPSCSTCHFDAALAYRQLPNHILSSRSFGSETNRDMIVHQCIFPLLSYPHRWVRLRSNRRSLLG